MISLSPYADRVTVSTYVDSIRYFTNADNMSTAIKSIRDFAAAVRGRRLKLGLSQERVAQQAHVSRQWLSEFESGKSTAELQLVIRLLDALGMNLRLDVLDEHQPGASASPPATVDLDMLLDEYRNP
jgi:HTH-type transcriptional regulator/antitoxin HipB